MAITVDWPRRVIYVNKADMIQVQANPVEIYQLDLDVFRLTLKDLEDDDEGIGWPDTHAHNTTVSVGGAILARVVQIVNGYTVTFEDGQYAVNLVGANSNVGDVVNVNQVSVRSSNSAGLQDLNSLQAASFAGQVALKPSSPYAGVVFPTGTRGFPVNNTEDARKICLQRGISTIVCMESLTLDSGTDFSDLGMTFTSDNPAGILVTLDPGINVTNSQFTNMTMMGTLDGNNTLRDCVVYDINFFNGYIHDSSLNGTITLGGELQANITNCISGIAGGGPDDMPVIDLGSGQDLAVRGYDGGLKLINGGGPDDHSLDFDSGRVIVESTVTDGTLTIRGVADVIDNSTGTAVVDDLTVTKEVRRTRRWITNREDLDEAGNRVIYADDGVTPLETQIVTDKDGGTITLNPGVPAKRSAPS